MPFDAASVPVFSRRAFGSDDQLARRSADLAGVAYADTGFSADQENLVGIHAAQARSVASRNCGAASS